MKIVGIDPGLVRTGYACLEVGGSGAVRVLDAGIFRLSARQPIAHRLKELDADLTALLEEWHPECMAVERVFSHSAHVRTAIVMAHARGVVLLAAARAEIAIHELAPASIKMAIAGTGAATKRQMQLAVAAQCGLARPPSPPDVADAIAIALAQARRIGALR